MSAGLARVRPGPIVLVTVLLGAHGSMAVGLIPCPLMSMTECVLVSVAVVVGASSAATAARAVHLAVRTARAVAALERGRPSPEVTNAARRAGLREVVCVAGADRTGFCAGLVRPRVYVTEDLHGPGLDAVLAHEAAHARRRDPLRRLVVRAASDVLFYLPLVSWWRTHQTQQSELHADRVAIERVGREAVAAALLSAGQGGRVAGSTAFDGVTQARVAQLLGEDIAVSRPSRTRLLLSLVGLIAATALAMCFGQTIVAVL